jgi:succinate dehydrogenase hydrophobic anchor subunit
MITKLVKTGFETPIISMLEKIPIISFYAKTRGWPFVLSWGHRLAGILVVLFVWFHIYSLASLHTPSVYDDKMQVFRLSFFTFLEWALAIPVIFHAFNGARLILYESFAFRDDEKMIRWMFALVFIYVALLGLLMLIGNQDVSPFFFWLIILATALVLGYGIIGKIRNTDHSIFWKLQRVSGAFLLIMVPAHFLFMHLNPSIGKDANSVLIRMQSYYVKGIDLTLILGVLYHGGYGLFSVIRDYLTSRVTRMGLTLLVSFVMVIFAWVGIKLILVI